ncbi:MAG: hypothetical protein U0935_16165 [Pirellulales bacterium]
MTHHTYWYRGWEGLAGGCLSCLAALLGLLYVIAIPFIGALLLLAALIEKLWRAVRPRLDGQRQARRLQAV